MQEPTNDIERLGPEHALAISNCFRAVYGESYANDLFYRVDALAAALESGRLRSVGAWRDDRLIGHMAMTERHANAKSAELGNTVVDPVARGDGLAWRVGAELTAWTRELGFAGYLHYPTTDHHIMQRQSVKRGVETGLMLGYIPTETDGQVQARVEALRGAATIVYEPLSASTDTQASYLPEHFANRIERFAEQCGLQRSWAPAHPAKDASVYDIEILPRRGLVRLTLMYIGADVAAVLDNADLRSQPCQQLDLSMSSDGLDDAISVALDQGWVFCGWLPGFAGHDLLRLQRFDLAATDTSPGVVNDTALSLLAEITDALP